MAVPPVAPASKAPASKAPFSKAPFSRAPLSRGPETVGPLSQFPGTSKRKPQAEKPKGVTLANGLQGLAAAVIFLLLVVGYLIYTVQEQHHQALVRHQALGEMRYMAQGLGRSAVLAVAGQSAGFAQLRDVRSRFPEQLGHLGEGDERQQALTKAWESVVADLTILQAQEKPLIAMGKVASVFDGQTAPLVDLSEQLLTAQKKIAGQAKEVEAAGQTVVLATRVTRNTGLLLTSDSVRPELALQLEQDTTAMARLVDALKNGSDSPKLGPISQPEVRVQVLALDKAFQEYKTSVAGVVGNIQMLTAARQAGGRLQKGSETLAAAAETLGRELQAAEAEATPYGTYALVLTALALILAVALVVLYQRDASARQAQALAQQQTLERGNKQNQEAIVRLMNELGNLANGDLTVKATVNEDITGAIADSVNYTVEEFRGTVQRINKAAERVAEATGGASQVSVGLLQAAKDQAGQIQQAGVSALEMAQSMNHVSADANRSAQVARKSLQVAQKGAEAVQDAMRGMNSIRDQIQETSKRIKRLGDSSLEIGEIVEMISDITEQTHVLALNAAIQAASAGDAGRGFTVVAEEVQRLAERSGEATKQIADIVKTIQADTRNAVAAMERSTLDVVEGAKLSDAAGQALNEVGEVSNQMAGLIDNISLATQKQSNTATQVAKRMKDILQITEQTTAGTQQTAQAVTELDKLVAELKGSVAGFKVQ